MILSPATTADHSQRMGLPVPSSTVAMVLFLATEAMFFAALVAAYIVLRMGAAAWPTQEQVHVDPLLGAANTLVLLASSFAIGRAVRFASRDRPATAKGWLLLSFVLGGLFLGVKAYEYRTKYRQQLWPTLLSTSVYDQPSVEYLGAVRGRLAALRSELLAAEATDAVRQRLEVLDQIDRQHLIPAEQLVRSDASGETRRTAFASLAAEVATLNDQHPWLRLPIVLPGGNVWATNYYLLTGAHAAHLAAGLIAMACFLMLRLDARWHVGLTNLGLYWHFVDGVWLMLFVMIYLL